MGTILLRSFFIGALVGQTISTSIMWYEREGMQADYETLNRRLELFESRTDGRFHGLQDKLESQIGIVAQDVDGLKYILGGGRIDAR